MCKCFQEVNEKLRERNGQLNFNLLAPPDKQVVTIDVIKIKPRGQRPGILIAAFCPFCGEAYPEEWYREKAK